MPEERIPDPASPSQDSCIFIRPNKHFVGREDDLRSLARTLKGRHTAAIGQIAAATGLGGIGKTQLASEFAHRYGRYFVGGVYWLNFADAAGVPAEVAKCCRLEESGLDLEVQIKHVLSAWQSQLPRLLVFDNCEDEDLLEQWRPKVGASRVLVTSRRQNWSDHLDVKAMAIGVLARNESVELLQRLADHISEQEAVDIAEELGDLPLALHLAGCFLDRYCSRVSARAYLAELQNESLLDHPAFKGRGVKGLPTQHEVCVAKSFAMSFDQLKPDEASVDRIALDLLFRAAFFAPGAPIPGPLLEKTLPDADILNPLDIQDGLERLLGLGLIEQEEQGDWLLHRLLVRFVEGVCLDDKALSDVEAMLFDAAIRINISGLPGELLVWQPHLRVATDRAMQRQDEVSAGLCNELGFHLESVGEYESARPYYEQALEIYKTVLGAEHPFFATSLNNLANLYDSQGRYEDAEPLYQQAMAIRKNVLGEDHPEFASSLNNLGAFCFEQKRYKEALVYMEQAYALFLKLLGEAHSNTKTSFKWLGLIKKAITNEG